MYWLITPLIAALWDWKTGDIPDWITVPGVITTFLYITTHSPHLLLPFITFAAFGYLFYRYGLVGGGDILLILAIFSFLSEYTFLDPIISPFLLLFLGITITSALYGFYHYLKDGKYHYLLPVLFLPLGLSVLYGVILFALLDKGRFIREVRTDELENEDVLVDIIPGFNKKVIEPGDIEKLKGMGIDKVKILVNLPRMGPGLFISILILLFPIESIKILLINPVLDLFHVFL